MPDPFVHFKVMVKERASDLILREGERPAIRVEGKIRFLSDERFTAEDAEALLAAILSPEEIAAFRVVMEKDVAFVVPGIGPLPREPLHAAQAHRLRLPPRAGEGPRARGPPSARRRRSCGWRSCTAASCS